MAIAITIIVALAVWIAWYLWRDWSITRDHRRCTAVWLEACKALEMRDMAGWQRLRAEHERLGEQFKRRWGYRL